MYFYVLDMMKCKLKCQHSFQNKIIEIIYFTQVQARKNLKYIETIYNSNI